MRLACYQTRTPVASPRSHDSEDLHHDGAGEVRDEHWEHEDAECATDNHAHDAVEFSEELRAHKLRLNQNKMGQISYINLDGFSAKIANENGVLNLRASCRG